MSDARTTWVLIIILIIITLIIVIIVTILTILIITASRDYFAGVSPHEAFAYCMELVPVCLCVLAPANLCMSLRNLVPLRGWGEEVHSPRA